MKLVHHWKHDNVHNNGSVHSSLGAEVLYLSPGPPEKLVKDDRGENLPHKGRAPEGGHGHQRQSSGQAPERWPDVTD
eukprot:CAMPEP_0204149074 /NCGR_PEP_ID=MMETSP0361-20130328/24097_1 /ASSEMBLY_ACC=CAM_ASM_000343 /TAXON_ID=268821 /ORGANISM="Scrippsiella Hangoei, Strain SHTV-5" /LENGTH=76 /DNA_ID=CAMNT_0051103525 /DNA_START=221 /DNA_END=448 /DNA_ORIENTATION=-